MVRATIVIIGLFSASAAAQPVQRMIFEQHTDPMTGEVVSLATLGNGGHAIGIGCRGRDRSLRIVYLADRHIVSTTWLTASRPFMFRFDQDQPVVTEWYYDGRTATQYSGPQLRRFIARMLTARRLRLRAYDYDRRPIDAEFDIVGAAAAIRQALEVCNDRRADRELGPLLRQD